MGQSLPKATTYFGHTSLDSLGPVGQAVVNGLTASAVAYPTPPVSIVDLQGFVNDYNTLYTASLGKDQLTIRQRDVAKLVLINALRADANYVNTVAWTMVQMGESYTSVSASITATGYRLALNPSPSGPVGQPQNVRCSSPNPGELRTLCNRLPGARSYIIVLGDVEDPASPTYSLPNSRMYIRGLISGSTQIVSVCGIGANTSARNFSIPVSQVIS